MEVTKGKGNMYLRRHIPALRGLQSLKKDHHGKVPAYSSVYILLYEKQAVYVLEIGCRSIRRLRKIKESISSRQLDSLGKAAL